MFGLLLWPILFPYNVCCVKNNSKYAFQYLFYYTLPIKTHTLNNNFEPGYIQCSVETCKLEHIYLDNCICIKQHFRTLAIQNNCLKYRVINQLVKWISVH